MVINVAFESGGIKGLAYVGVIKYLEERGYKIFKASGTSVGAIFAALLVSGFKYKEIIDIIENINVSQIIKENNLKDKIKGKGFNSICNLENKIAEILAKKKIKTFQDLKYGDSYRLKIIVTDNKNKKSVIIPDDLIKYNINPDTFKIAKAIAMSCSIPIVYSEYRIGENRFVDGGATYRFPLEVVIDGVHPVLGVRLIRNNKLLLDFIQNKIYTTKSNCLEDKNVVILEIKIDDIKATQFAKGLKNKEVLYKVGYCCALKNLNNK